MCSQFLMTDFHMYFWNTNQFILWQIMNNVVPITALEIKKYCIATILFEEIKFKGAIDYYIKGWIFLRCCSCGRCGVLLI